MSQFLISSLGQAVLLRKTYRWLLSQIAMSAGILFKRFLSRLSILFKESNNELSSEHSILIDIRPVFLLFPNLLRFRTLLPVSFFESIKLFSPEFSNKLINHLLSISIVLRFEKTWSNSIELDVKKS
jgi:hypothetical protein